MSREIIIICSTKRRNLFYNAFFIITDMGWQHCKLLRACGRRSGLMVSALDSGQKGRGFESWPGHCVVFLGKTLYFQCLSPPCNVNGYQHVC